jgi:hypothetical protein
MKTKESSNYAASFKEITSLKEAKKECKQVKTEQHNSSR